MATQKISPNMVADYLILRCHEVGDPITNLKLQKLVYYAQAWHLALYNKPLFEDDFEAWIHGPVIPSLYQRFKRRGESWEAISQTPKTRPRLPRSVKEHLDEVLTVYNRFSAWDLQRMTHAEEPWQKARKGLSPDERGKEIISKENMKAYYKKRLAKSR